MNDHPILDVQHVAKSYRQSEGGPLLNVLTDVNLTLAPGDSLAVIGPSGCGKSTLLNLIGGLDQPDAGRIALDGVDLAGLDARALAAVRSEQIGFVFQQHHLLPQCTVWENVLVPTLACRRRATTPQDPEPHARALLDRVGLADRLDHRPGQLSGGERQRVATVRALINRPKLLLADEPTGELDEDSAANLMELLVELNRDQGVTLIAATHARDLAERLDRLERLELGRLVPREAAT